MKPEQPINEQIIEAIEDVKVAMLDNIEASKKIVEAQAEKTKCHYTLLKAKERLTSLERELLV